MRVQKAIGLALLVQAIAVGAVVSGSLESLLVSSAAFSYPSDPAIAYYGLMMLNVFLVIAPAVLGVYLVRSVAPSVTLVIMLSGVSALYGGFGLVLPLFAMGLCILQKHRTVRSNNHSSEQL